MDLKSTLFQNSKCATQTYRTAGYSGHVDLIVKGLVINGYELEPKGGLNYIEVWSRRTDDEDNIFYADSCIIKQLMCI